jgi:hypothetical protein
MENIQPLHSDQINEIASALSKAQAHIKGAVKSKKNPFFKSNYADFPAIWDACYKHLTSQGISITQSLIGGSDNMTLVTQLSHTSGQWFKSYYPIILIKKDAQSQGSAVTYAKRYSLSALVGVCSEDEDDDGEAATAPSRKVEEKKIDEDLVEAALKRDGFCDKFPDLDFSLIHEYLIKYCQHWKKTTAQAILDYQDKEKFLKEFNCWKNKKK